MMQYKAFFFDLDGTLIDSMPNHVTAWVNTLQRYGIAFSARDCYINEGRTGRDVIVSFAAQSNVIVSDELRERIYNEKTTLYRQLGGANAMADMDKVLMWLRQHDVERWVVTGSGLNDLHAQLESFYPGMFAKNRMITAYDVCHGKPDPEPYLKAIERSGLKKEECCVVENAPLGIRSGKSAGLFTIGVNTGALTRNDLLQAGADLVMDDVHQLYQWLTEGC